MAIWEARFISFDGATNYTANLTLDDLGDGRAKGTLRHLGGPTPVEEIDLAGVVLNDHYTVQGKTAAVEVILGLRFTPFVPYALSGGSRFLDRETKQTIHLFVITQGID